MAIIQPVRVRNDSGTYEITMEWQALTEADSGAYVKIPRFNGKTFHAFGTFGGGAVTIYGSNNSADLAKEPSDVSSSWQALTDVDGLGNMVLTSAKAGAEALENYTYNACEVTSGASVSLTVGIEGQRRV